MRRLLGILLLSPALQGCVLTSWFTSTRSEFVAPEPELLQARLAYEGEGPRAEVEHFAVLLGGDTELRHRGSMSLAYQVLLEQGYRRDRVYILDSEGDNPFFPATDITTHQAVVRLLKHLAKVLGPEDSLLLFLTGHCRRVSAAENEGEAAGTIEASAWVLNPGEEMSQEELMPLLEDIHPAAGIVFFDQCFPEPWSLAKLPNYVVIRTQAADASQAEGFPRAFWSAFRDKRRVEGPLSLFDAFRRAMVADRATVQGHNRPRITHAQIRPRELSLLGERHTPPVEAQEVGGEVQLQAVEPGGDAP